MEADEEIVRSGAPGDAKGIRRAREAAGVGHTVSRLPYVEWSTLRVAMAGGEGDAAHDISQNLDGRRGERHHRLPRPNQPHMLELGQIELFPDDQERVIPACADSQQGGAGISRRDGSAKCRLEILAVVR